MKGLGLEVDGQAQVSMNLVDTEKTPLYRAFDMVKMEAEARGVIATWSEIVGLVPERALFETAARHIQLRDFTPEMVLEHKVRAGGAGRPIGQGFRRGGGVVDRRRPAAAASRRTPARSPLRSRRWSPDSPSGRKKYAAVDAEMREARAQGGRPREHARRRSSQRTPSVQRRVARVQAADRARRRRRESAEEAIDDALLGAADVPLETARACAEVAELALIVAAEGEHERRVRRRRRRAARRSGLQGAVYNVRINVARSTIARLAPGSSPNRSKFWRRRAPAWIRCWRWWSAR